MKAFVMMPYKPKFDDVYEKAIKPSIEGSEMTAYIVKEQHYTGPVIEKILKMIEDIDTKFCVADVTDGNPNVMMEVAYSQARNKPVIFIAQGSADKIPFNVRHNRCILYSGTNEGLERLKDEIKLTIKSILGGERSDLDAIRQIIFPKSIESNQAKLVIATNPLSFGMAYRVREGWQGEPKTISDYVGIRGLMQSFGMILGLQRLPELVNPDDFKISTLNYDMHLYSIGSSKVNQWTGEMMDKFFEKRKSKWDFRPDPKSKYIRNPRVIIQNDGMEHIPAGWGEADDRIKRDFGIVLRGPNFKDSSLMVTVLAGRASTGTVAASLAVTDPGCVRKLMRELKHSNIDPEEHRKSFLAIVSVETKIDDAGIEILKDTFKVWHVHEC
jgi:hypothetical protein